jgi:hypothetical protein
MFLIVFPWFVDIRLRVLLVRLCEQPWTFIGSMCKEKKRNLNEFTSSHTSFSFWSSKFITVLRSLFMIVVTF